ncbi:hypothetical protein SNEBB_007143 [Seison nebaliae]|nr:hypothetical protein SNEBB_007143 [Seison nebaliae]
MMKSFRLIPVVFGLNLTKITDEESLNKQDLTKLVKEGILHQIKNENRNSKLIWRNAKKDLVEDKKRRRELIYIELLEADQYFSDNQFETAEKLYQNCSILLAKLYNDQSIDLLEYQMALAEISLKLSSIFEKRGKFDVVESSFNFLLEMVQFWSKLEEDGTLNRHILEMIIYSEYSRYLFQHSSNDKLLIQFHKKSIEIGQKIFNEKFSSKNFSNISYESYYFLQQYWNLLITETSLNYEKDEFNWDILEESIDIIERKLLLNKREILEKNYEIFKKNEKEKYYQFKKLLNHVRYWNWMNQSASSTPMKENENEINFLFLLLIISLKLMRIQLTTNQLLANEQLKEGDLMRKNSNLLKTQLRDYNKLKEEINELFPLDKYLNYFSPTLTKQIVEFESNTFQILKFIKI